MCPSNSYVAAYLPNVVVFGNGAFRRSSGLDEVVRVGPRDGSGALVRGDTRGSRALSLPHEDAEGRWHLQVRTRVLAGNQPGEHADLGLPVAEPRVPKCLSFRPWEL